MIIEPYAKARLHGQDTKTRTKIGILLIILSLAVPGTAIALITGTEAEAPPDDPEPLQFLWDIEIVGPVGDVAQDTSIALDSNETPHIAYCLTTGGAYDLMYASKIDGGWNIEAVETAGKTGLYASLAIDDNDIPHISYQDGLNRDLKYATKIGGFWNMETVDSQDSVGWFTSIALDNNGNPHISYHNLSSGELKYAVKNGSVWDIETVGVGKDSRIAFDAGNNPHISYSMGDCNLMHAEKIGGSWSIETVSSDWNWYAPSIAIDNAGIIHIAYTAGMIGFLRYAVKIGGSWSVETVDVGPVGPTGGYPSIALDSLGRPHIFYHYNTDGSLKYATKINNVWVIEIVDFTAFVGLCISHTMDSDDYPHISYIDDDNDILKYAKGTPLPDLVVSNIELKPSSPVLDKTMVSINATISNIGVRDATNVLVVIRDGLNKIGEEQIPMLIAAIGVEYVEVSWIATPPIPHDIGVQVDPYNTIPEYDDSNNMASEKLEVVGAPDLMLLSSDISFNTSSPVINDSPITIDATIHNLGSVQATDVVVRFYDGAPPTNLIGEDQISTISAYGGIGWAEAEWIATPTGTHNIYVVVDPDDNITEGNESNNIASKVLEVIGILPPKLNVEVVGDDIILNWTSPRLQGASHYLLYRSSSQTGFDFSDVWVNTFEDADNGKIPLRTTWNDTGAASGTAPQGYYYSIRTVFNSGEVSSTSRTVGKFTRNFTGGISTFSLPLKPLQPISTDDFATDMNAICIKHMDTTTHTWELNNVVMEVGKGYEVNFSAATRYTFTGMPAAMILYNDASFGFDTSPGGNAASLTATVDDSKTVNLSWLPAASIDSGYEYHVLRSTTRHGFWGVEGTDYEQIANVSFNTLSYQDIGIAIEGTEYYYMVVPVNLSTGEKGSSSYSLGVWTAGYLDGYDTLALPLRPGSAQTADWYCDNIPNTVGINYYINSEQRWGWHPTRMSSGVYDPVLEMTEGYQISTSSATKYTFVGV